MEDPRSRAEADRARRSVFSCWPKIPFDYINLPRTPVAQDFTWIVAFDCRC